MNLKNITADLNALFQETEIEDLADLSFDNETFNQLKINHFNSGFWSTVPFATTRVDNLLSVRLLPNYEVDQMPVVRSSNILKNNCVTYASNLSTLLITHEINLLKDNGMRKFYKEDLSNGLLDPLAEKLWTYTGEFHSFDFMKSYLNHENFQRFERTEDEYEDYTSVYLDLLSHYSNSNEFQKTAELIQFLDKKSVSDIENYFNDFTVKKTEISLGKVADYGIWNTMVYNTLIQCYYHLSSNKKNVSELKYAWYSFIQPHGFDAVSMAFKTLPNIHSSAERSSSCLSSVLNTLNSSEYNKLPKDILEHPLLHVAEVIKKSNNTYIGAEHVEAAALLDEKYNDPIGVWNALVSAGYWCGQNANKPNIPAWEAAVYLSEKHNWKAINEVLVNQLDFYNNYKEK